jgi:uridine kinase
MIDKAYRGKKRRAIEAAQQVKLKSRVSKKTLERGQLVKQVMNQYKITLGQASKFIKDNGLYVKN